MLLGDAKKTCDELTSKIKKHFEAWVIIKYQNLNIFIPLLLFLLIYLLILNFNSLNML
jgi:hypothetical protein